MRTRIFAFIVITLFTTFLWLVMTEETHAPVTACTTEALICPDETAVGRTAPHCEFAPCPKIPTMNNLIVVSSPTQNSEIASPITITGKARGTWFFEANFPITVVNWDGLIIGEGIAEAQSNWMTEDFVPFTATISYSLSPETPYSRGAIILKKENPSGLPEHDNYLEIPVIFQELTRGVQ